MGTENWEHGLQQPLPEFRREQEPTQAAARVPFSSSTGQQRTEMEEQVKTVRINNTRADDS